MAANSLLHRLIWLLVLVNLAFTFPVSFLDGRSVSEVKSLLSPGHLQAAKNFLKSATLAALAISVEMF